MGFLRPWLAIHLQSEGRVARSWLRYRVVQGARCGWGPLCKLCSRMGVGATNQGAEAVDSMKRAALGGFLPAKLDLVTLVWNGRDPTGRNRRVAYDLLNHADGHKAAMVWRCRLNRSGEFGLIRQLLGYLLAPVAFLRYAVAFWTNPLSCKVLVFQPWMTRPHAFDTLASQG
jgi:hypothetical protein